MAVLDPIKYMQAQTGYNQQRALQRANQQREDFQQFTPDLTTDFTGLKLGAQPGTQNLAEQARLDKAAKEKEAYELKIKNRAYIDPNKAPDASAAAMDTTYNYYGNQVEKRFKDADYTGLTPNIGDLSWGRGIDELAGEKKDYFLNKYGEPISVTGRLMRHVGLDTDENTIDEFQTKLAIANTLADKGFVEGIDDVNKYLEYGKPNMKPGAAAGVLQSRIDKKRLDDLSATLDFTKDERKELDRISKLPLGSIDDKEKHKVITDAKKAIAQKIDLRRQKDALAKIKDLPDGPDKAAKLEEFADTLKASALTDETVNVRQSDGSYRAMPKIVAEIQGIKKTTDPVEIIKTFQNVTLREAGNATRVAIDQRDEFVRLANIAKSKGNEEEFNKYRLQIKALNQGIILSQGMQGLTDLDGGDTRRLSVVVSNSLGSDVQIIPRDDNKFNVVIDGNIRNPNGESADKLKIEFRNIFDNDHKKQMQAIAIARANEILTSKLKMSEQAMKDRAQFIREIAVKKQEGYNKLREKGWTITKTDDGTVAQKDGVIGVLESKTVENQAGDDETYLFLKNVNTMGLGEGVGLNLNVESYISATQ